VPMCHSYGVENVLMGPLWGGASICCVEGFVTTQVLEFVTGGGVTVLPGVPFMFHALTELAGPDAVHALRCAYAAGSPLPRRTAEAFMACFGIPVRNLYGATEVGSVTISDVETAGLRPNCVGAPMPGVVVRVIDAESGDAGTADGTLGPDIEGEVLIAAPSMLTGYVDDDAPALANGFFHTGDLGSLDSDGRLTITGRLKLQIDIGGMKVNPLEVEDVLVRHPHVREAVVIPLPVTDTVSRLRAVVIPESGDVDAAALRAFMRARLAPHKIPRLIEQVTSFPRSPTGKVLRRRLQEP
jgi:long-chain acyl-CoA synthetase